MLSFISFWNDFSTIFKTEWTGSKCRDSSEFAICHVVRHCNVNSIQNPHTVTDPTMEPYCILLPQVYVAMPYNRTNRKLISEWVLNDTIWNPYTPYRNILKEEECKFQMDYPIRCFHMKSLNFVS